LRIARIPVAAALTIVFALPLRAETGWLIDFQEALAFSRQEGKIILADFTGSDWCKWCQRLESEVFAKSQFQAWARENVILLKIDFPRLKLQPLKYKYQNEYLAKKYRVKSYPTILFLEHDGSIAGKMGYMRGGADNWIARAESLINRHKAQGAGSDRRNRSLRDKVDRFFERYFH